MSRTKQLNGAILTILLGLIVYVVYQIPHRIDQPSDLAEHVGHRVWISGKVTNSKLGGTLDFQATPISIGWPHELSNRDEGIAAIGTLRKNSVPSGGFLAHDREYAIVDAVQLDKIGITGMLYHETFRPFLDSRSKLATICILLGCFLIPIVPAMIIAAFSGVQCYPVLRMGVLWASIAYGVSAFSFNSGWLGHHDIGFQVAAKNLGAAAFASTMLFACFAIVRRRREPDESENHGVHRSTA